MEHAKTITAVVQNLKELFKDKDNLHGVDDWDRFIGCLCALERIAADLTKEEEEE